MDKRRTVQEIVDSLGDKRWDFLSQVNHAIKNYIENQGLDCLTLVERNKDGSLLQRWEARPTLDYAGRLIAFCRGTPFK